MIENSFQYRSEELKGQRLSVLLSGPEAKDYDHYLRGRTEGRQVNAVDVDRKQIAGKRKDGSILQMVIFIKVLHVDDRQQLIAIISDVTGAEQRN